MARWDGSIECQGARIEEARGYAFDSPAEGLRGVTENRVEWESVTTGDSDGVILTLDPADQGTLKFSTGYYQLRAGVGRSF